MSYILEALKKLEENRPKTELPGLLHDPDQAPARPQMRRFLPHLLIAALLINAGIFLWWLHPWEKTKPAAVAAGTPLPRASFIPQAKEQPRAEENITMRKEDVHLTAGGNSREQRRPAPPVSETGSRSAGMAREDRRVYSLADLPASARQDLPDIVISGHSYAADPSSRIVLINGKTMREGQAVTGGLVLEQITPDGVILGFQGYRLRRGIF